MTPSSDDAAVDAKVADSSYWPLIPYGYKYLTEQDVCMANTGAKPWIDDHLVDDDLPDVRISFSDSVESTLAQHRISRTFARTKVRDLFNRNLGKPSVWRSAFPVAKRETGVPDRVLLRDCDLAEDGSGAKAPISYEVHLWVMFASQMGVPVADVVSYKHVKPGLSVHPQAKQPK